MRRLPRELSDNRAELTKSQMIDAVTKLDRQLQVAAQPLATRTPRSSAVAAGRQSVPGRAASPAVGQLSAMPHRAGAARAARAASRRHRADEADALEAVVKLLERKARR
jgi:hypothetical protein